MQKILMILLWPAGLAVIIGIGALLARRSSDVFSPFSQPPAHPRTRRAVRRDGGRRETGGQPAGPRRSPRGRFLDGRLFPGRLFPGRLFGRLFHERGAVTRFLVTLLVGVGAVYLASVVIGLIAVHGGPSIDKPIWHWTASHQAHGWVSLMKKATQTAATFTVLGAAAAAAVCLVFVWRRDRWLPPVALAALIVVDHYLTMALTDTFNRVPPPHSGGTFPSGASDRAVAYYGLIAFLLWRAVSGRRKAAIWAGMTVAALAFTEAYSRGYLMLHWFTDIASGLLYGTLLLTAFAVAVGAAASEPAGGDVARGAPANSEITDMYAAAASPRVRPPRAPRGYSGRGRPVAGARVAGARVAGTGAGPAGRPVGGRHASGEGVA